MSDGTAQLAALARQLKLTKAQAMFAEEWAKGATQTDAAIHAGSSKQPAIQGSRWARLDKVRTYRDAVANVMRARGEMGSEARIEAAIMDALEVQAEMSKLGRAPIPADKINARVKLGALEALARIHGLDKGAAGGGSVVVNIDKLVALGSAPLQSAYRALLKGGDGNS